MNDGVTTRELRILDDDEEKKNVKKKIPEILFNIIYQKEKIPDSIKVYYKRFKHKFTDKTPCFYGSVGFGEEIKKTIFNKYGVDVSSSSCVLIGLFCNYPTPDSIPASQCTISIGLYEYVDEHVNKCPMWSSVELTNEIKKYNTGLLDAFRHFGVFRQTDTFKKNKLAMCELDINNKDLSELNSSLLSNGGDQIEFKPDSKFFNLLKKYAIIDSTNRKNTNLTKLQEDMDSVLIKRQVVVDFLIPMSYAFLDDPFQRLFFLIKSTTSTFSLTLEFHLFFYYQDDDEDAVN